MNLWNINIFLNLKSFVFYISKNVLPGTWSARYPIFYINMVDDGGFRSFLQAVLRTPKRQVISVSHHTTPGTVSTVSKTCPALTSLQVPRLALVSN